MLDKVEMSERFLNNHQQPELNADKWLALFATMPSLGVDIETPNEGIERWIFTAQLEIFLKKFPENKGRAAEVYLDKMLTKRTSLAQLAPAELVSFYPASWSKKSVVQLVEVMALIEKVAVAENALKNDLPLNDSSLLGFSLPTFSFFIDQASSAGYELAFAYLEKVHALWQKQCRSSEGDSEGAKVVRKKVKRRRTDAQSEGEKSPSLSLEQRLRRIFPTITKYQVLLVNTLLNVEKAVLRRPAKSVVIDETVLTNLVEHFPSDGSDDLENIDVTKFHSLYSKQARRMSLLSSKEEVALSKLIKRGGQATLLLIAEAAQEVLPFIEDEKDSQMLSTIVERCFDYQTDFTTVEQQLRASLPQDSIVITEELIQEFISKGEQARKWLAAANIALVIEAVGKVRFKYGNTLPFEELVQVGNVGLMSAVINFSPWGGARFSTFATPIIKRRLLRGVQSSSRIIRVGLRAGENIRKMIAFSSRYELIHGEQPADEILAKKLGLSIESIVFYKEVAARQVSSLSDTVIGDIEVGDTLPDNTTLPPEEQLIISQRNQALEKVVDKLPPREAQVLQLRYGLADGGSWTLEEVADKFGVTRQAISAIEQRALRRLRGSAGISLEDFF